MTKGDNLRGNIICWCGHPKWQHWWWDEEAGEVFCDGQERQCDCAEYVPAAHVTRAKRRQADQPRP